MRSRCETAFRWSDFPSLAQYRRCVLILAMPAMPGKNLIRTYSTTSAGATRSGRQDRHSLTLTERLEEFRFHSDRYQRVRKTALISTSDCFLWMLKEAFNRYHSGDVAAEIHIVFIHVPHEQNHIYYHGKELAEMAGVKDPVAFSLEYLFEWEIPAEFILHTVSLQTLIDRKLLDHIRWLDLEVWNSYQGKISGELTELPSTSGVRECMINDISVATIPTVTVGKLRWRRSASDLMHPLALSRTKLLK